MARDSLADGLKLMINDIDEKGDLKDWCGLARRKRKWPKTVEERIRVEKCDFGEMDDEPIDSGNINTNIDEKTNVPRRQPSNSNGRRETSPNRDTIEPTNLNRRQALRILNCNSDEKQREMRRKRRMLASKHYPGKWCIEHEFSKEDEMKIFKGIADACELLVP